jgi:hypothetical protein
VGEDYEPFMQAEEMTPEEAAKAHHAFCLARWEHLSEEQRRGTTFHGWDAHLPRQSADKETDRG